MINFALDLRRAGQSYHTIGSSMRVSKTRAYQLVLRGLEELQTQSKEKAEGVRELELLRLDSILLAHWLNRSDPRSADTILRVMERRAKLLGLDAPKGGGSEKNDRLDEVVSALRAVAEMPEPGASRLVADSRDSEQTSV